MPEIRGVGAQILVNNTPLEEYQVEVVDEKTVRCYIASEAGQGFAIKVLNNLNQETSCSIDFDGERMLHELCRASTSPVISEVPISKYESRPMQFALLNISDDDSLLEQDRNAWEKLGLIEIYFRRARIIGETGSMTRREVQPRGVRPVHERSKKAGAHCIGLGSISRNVRPLVFCKATYIDPPEAPFATIEFRYRPKGLLQAQGIIPTPQKNINESSKKRKADVDDIIDLTVPEEKEDLKAVKAQLQASIRQQEALRSRLNRLEGQKGEPSAKRVKREPGIHVPDSGDVIDLTV
ncbi:hypothetical protein K474DRAFT_1705599 [Panus rudis PR-1116 ss-1]|nr:hypothetical protein K474DRAFT_1705599 [Panus rudis PR-1116 ss-1]